MRWPAASPNPGVTASVQFTNRLLEGAGIVAGEGGESADLQPAGRGRPRAAVDLPSGEVRLELQSEKRRHARSTRTGTLTVYDVASAHALHVHAARSTSPRPTPPAQRGQTPAVGRADRRSDREARKAREVSGAEPTDVAGRAAYTVRVSPREKRAACIGGAEL